MPYKDPEKRKKMFEETYYPTISIRLSRKRDQDVALYQGLTDVREKYGIGHSDFIRQAVEEKLERERAIVAVTASPAELRTGITKSHKSRPRRRLRLGVIPEKPDKP